MRGPLSILAAGGLGACASTGPAASVADSYGDYLVARFAESRQDHAAALARYFEALARGERARELVAGATAAALASGDTTGALRAARLDERIGADVAAALLVRAAEDLRA
ncbi:MAG: hypothetical protein HXY28_08880, partial [Hydrogenophilaceae bacterium]|nr:hypothetical protein [Hydrogenophilaceae bacterium]